MTDSGQVFTTCGGGVDKSVSTLRDLLFRYRPSQSGLDGFVSGSFLLDVFSSSLTISCGEDSSFAPC
jgi:hypothetical protein